VQGGDRARARQLVVHRRGQWYGGGRGAVVEDDVAPAVLGLPGARLDGVRQTGQDGVNPGLLPYAVEKVARGRRVWPGGEVLRAALAEPVPGDGRFPGEGAGRETLDGLGALQADLASSRTSPKIRLDGPPCGTIAEWNFAAPPRDCRHWKNITASAPCATACQLHSRIAPGGLAALRGRSSEVNRA
jgi:hypothetical protein